MGVFNATPLAVADVRSEYTALLAPGEQMLHAFKFVRDQIFFTSKRIITVNVQGMTGKKVEVASIPYRAVTGFSVETAGSFDLDADIKIHVSGRAKPIELELSRAADTKSLQMTLATLIG